MRSMFLACWLVLCGCDQFAPIGVEQASLADSGSPPNQPPMNTPDAMSVPDAMASVPDAMTIDPDAAIADAGADAATECPDVSIPVCNPVTNEFFVQDCGPAFNQQCGIDQFNVLTGYCVFMSTMPPALGGACLNVGVTESCPPTSACSVDGICRKICLCDADCGAGECCVEPVGTTGFSLCGPC